MVLRLKGLWEVEVSGMRPTVWVVAAAVICQEELSAEKSREQWEVPVEMWLGGFVDGVYGRDNGVETKEE